MSVLDPKLHLRAIGVFWLIAGFSLFACSWNCDWPQLKDGEIDRWVLLHWGASSLLVTLGCGLFKNAVWAKITLAVLLLPLTLICLDMLLMLGVTRSGMTYFKAVLPFLITLVALAYSLLVLIALMMERAGTK